MLCTNVELAAIIRVLVELVECRESAPNTFRICDCLYRVSLIKHLGREYFVLTRLDQRSDPDEWEIGRVLTKGDEYSEIPTWFEFILSMTEYRVQKW